MQPGDLGLCVRAMSFSTTGSANARVLPDPVLARPIKSRPVAEAHAGRVVSRGHNLQLACGNWAARLVSTDALDNKLHESVVEQQASSVFNCKTRMNACM